MHSEVTWWSCQALKKHLEKDSIQQKSLIHSIILHQPRKHPGIPLRIQKKTIINLVFNYITHPITRLIKEHHRHLNGLWDHWRHRLGRVWRISTQWRSSSCLEVSLLVEVSWGWFSNIPCMNPWRWMIVFNWWRRFRMSYYMSLKSFVLAIWIWIW